MCFMNSLSESAVMLILSSFLSLKSGLHDKASAQFCIPGLYLIFRLQSTNVLMYYTTHQLVFYRCQQYAKFTWSIKARTGFLVHITQYHHFVRPKISPRNSLSQMLQLCSASVSVFEAYLTDCHFSHLSLWNRTAPSVKFNVSVSSLYCLSGLDATSFESFVTLAINLSNAFLHYRVHSKGTPFYSFVCQLYEWVS